LTHPVHSTRYPVSLSAQATVLATATVTALMPAADFF
jgi:hypothetical protein